MKVITFIAL